MNHCLKKQRTCANPTAWDWQKLNNISHFGEICQIQQNLTGNLSNVVVMNHENVDVTLHVQENAKLFQN